ncbi:Wadjet anti-phage system protein JetD domain-containing protein [Marinobacterium aestuariivivens]|uniref:Wadjet anti-phage system protein JetD domain-containing protein n=1 Tax=Marinobacterium aestuariivivens TaxID=1698799 RepID=A0ABW2AA47_9GAMM
MFITENKINGLAFPPLFNALVIFGLGYGVEQLGRIDWLKEKEIHYWGDIDSHGFNILAQLRKQLPQTRSLLMDEATLLELRELWVEEPQPQRNFDTGSLTADEATLLDALWHNRWGHNLRLEQERIPFSRLQRHLQQLDQLEQEAI